MKKTVTLFQPSTSYFQRTIENMPQIMSYFEGDLWCACYLNYHIEDVLGDGDEKATMFSLKVTGGQMDSVKAIMVNCKCNSL